MSVRRTILAVTALVGFLVAVLAGYLWLMTRGSGPS